MSLCSLWPHAELSAFRVICCLCFHLFNVFWIKKCWRLQSLTLSSMFCCFPPNQFNFHNLIITLNGFDSTIKKWQDESIKATQWWSRCTTLCLHTETGHVDPVLIERYNTPGFVGCLSRVEFNGVAPLKSALRTATQPEGTQTASPPGRQPAVASPASYQGKLVESNCGASPLTIPPMSAATDPWHLDNTGEDIRKIIVSVTTSSSIIFKCQLKTITTNRAHALDVTLR